MILDHLAFFDAQWGHANAQAVTARSPRRRPTMPRCCGALGDQGLQWSTVDNSYLPPEATYTRAEQPDAPATEDRWRSSAARCSTTAAISLG